MRRSSDAEEMQHFVDALREVLGLGPLYGIATRNLTEFERHYKPVSGVLGPGNYRKMNHNDRR